MINILRDKDGIKYKYPNRTCKNCELYPCFKGIQTLHSDFAKYGCRKYTGDTWQISSIKV